MKFRNFRPYTGATTTEQYLGTSLRSDFLELVDGLHRLKLEENLESFTYEGTISAGEEVEIRNQLSTIPGGRLIVKHSGDPAIVDGDTEWDLNFVYLKNSGSSSATVKVIYFK